MKKARDVDDIYRLRGKNREYLPGDRTGESRGGDIDTGFRHSSAYHAFFEGYTEREVLDEKGRKRIQRVYIAPWIVEDLTPARRHRVRLAAWALYLTAVAIYLWCMTRRVGSNGSYYVAAPGLLTVIPLLLLFFALITFTVRKEKLTKYDYKSNTKKLKILSLSGTILMALTAAMVLLYFLLHMAERNWGELLGSVMLAVSTLCLLGLWRTVSKIPYKEVENTASVSGGGFEIR